MNTVQVVLSGALLGGLYALMAAGVSVTWGVLRVINLAHFGLILVGAYLTFELVTTWRIDPVLTVVITAPVLFVVGAGLQWAYDRLGITEFNSLLVSFGLLIIINQVCQNIWTASDQDIPLGQNPYKGALHIGELALPYNRMVAFGFALLALGGGHLVLRNTFLGRGMRAFTQDRTVAAAFGIDHRRLGTMLGGAAGASAALAGMAFALANPVTPAASFSWFGTVFAVVILGGLGNLLGTLLAGVSVGVVTGLVGMLWAESNVPIALFAAIILALVLRPQGVFTRRRTA